MISHVPSFENLVHELSKLPGVGNKSAQRLAYFILKSPQFYTDNLQSALRQMKQNVQQCPQCFSYTEGENLCRFCSDSHRQDEMLCVVEDPSDISRIEASGVFKGRYHVLGGAISPLEGVAPEDLKIQQLMQKIENGKIGQGPVIEELILALDADLEGDTTVLYLVKLLRDKNIKVTRIAHGVPIGGDIDYIDYRTLGRALENRIEL